MKKYISRIQEVYEQQGILPVITKSIRSGNILLKRKLTINKRSLKNWEKLKGSYKGKRVFLIGNGPSLNKTALYLLQDEYTMCFNRFNVMFERIGWLPTFYMCVDPLVAEDMASELNEIVKDVKIGFFPDIHTQGLDFRNFINDGENIQWLFPDFKGFYFNLPNVGLGGTVAYPALQVLTYLGFSEIYLLGVDMNYKIHETAKNLKDRDIKSTKDDDPNHFDPRYFGKDRKYHQPVKSVRDNMMASLEFAAKKISENSTTKVFNAGVDSNVTCFEKVEFEKLFHVDSDEKFTLFTRPFEKVFPFKNEEQMLLGVPLITDMKVPADIDFFLCNTEMGAKLIGKTIFDYIPYGPFNGRILFISRKIFGS